jgi:hypothetical protein
MTELGLGVAVGALGGRLPASPIAAPPASKALPIWRALRHPPAIRLRATTSA